MSPPILADRDEGDDSDEKPRYEDVDWDKLLPDVLAAAKELGYTKEIWDAEDGKIDLEDKEWDELTADEKRLLSVCGYNEDLVGFIWFERHSRPLGAVTVMFTDCSSIRDRRDAPAHASPPSPPPYFLSRTARSGTSKRAALYPYRLNKGWIHARAITHASRRVKWSSSNLSAFASRFPQPCRVVYRPLRGDY